MNTFRIRTLLINISVDVMMTMHDDDDDDGDVVMYTIAPPLSKMLINENHFWWSHLIRSKMSTRYLRSVYIPTEKNRSFDHFRCIIFHMHSGFLLTKFHCVYSGGVELFSLPFVVHHVVLNRKWCTTFLFDLYGCVVCLRLRWDCFQFKN